MGDYLIPVLLPRNYLDLFPHDRLNTFAGEADKCVGFIEALQKDTNNFKDQSPSDLLVQDLFANAERRASQGKFDDGVARLYRVVEMIGQIAFKQHFGCSTGKALPDKLPQEFLNASSEQPGDDGTMKLGLRETFSALRFGGHDLGERFEKAQQLDSHLRLRNDSILAHGQRALNEKDYKKLRDAVVSFQPVSPIPPFPTLVWM